MIKQLKLGWGLQKISLMAEILFNAHQFIAHLFVQIAGLFHERVSQDASHLSRLFLWAQLRDKFPQRRLEFKCFQGALRASIDIQTVHSRRRHPVYLACYCSMARHVKWVINTWKRAKLCTQHVLFELLWRRLLLVEECTYVCLADYDWQVYSSLQTVGGVVSLLFHSASLWK